MLIGFVITLTSLNYIYAFQNPDLKANGHFHCHVEPESVVPLHNGMMPSAEAIDVTGVFLNLFFWHFMVQVIGISAIIVGTFALNNHEDSPNALLMFLGLSITYGIGMIAMIAIGLILRTRWSSRVCSGDFIPAHQKPDRNLPYMISSGDILEFLTGMWGL